MKCSHDRKVRSFAKETLGSTRTGSAMRFVAVRWSKGCVDITKESYVVTVVVSVRASQNTTTSIFDKL